MTLTADQKKEIRIQIEAELYSRSFYEFVKAAVKVLEPSTDFKWNWNIEYLCGIAEKEVNNIGLGIKKDKDYIINVCPRSMKSLIWSIMLNAWAWTKFPHLKFMTISYSEILAATFSYKTRLLITSTWYQDHWGNKFQINSDDNRKTSYSNDKSGTRESYGTHGSITGAGADIIIIDDVQKVNDISDLKLQNVIESYRDIIFNRINDPEIGVRFIIGQRTDESDLCGHLLSTQPGQYKHICIPMMLNDNVLPIELRENYIDGLLWPERFSNKVIKEYISNLGTRTFETQYQQAPVSNLGNIIKRDWFDIKEYSLEDLNKIKFEMFIDSAYTSELKNDATAIMIAGKYNNLVVIKKVYTFYLEFPDLCRKIIDLSNQINQGGRIFIEPKASGKSIVQQLKRETNLNVVELPSPKDSKITRINSITPKLESKRCVLLKDSSNQLFLQQVTAFPFAKADDIVDVLYYAVDTYLTSGDNKTIFRMI